MVVLSKLPVPLTILFFIGNSSTQTICYLVFFIFILILSLLIPYRRRIYRWVTALGATVLSINGAIAIAVAEGSNSYGFDVLWIIVLVLSLCLTVLQVVVNYEYFVKSIKYGWQNLKKLCDNPSKDEKN